MNATTICSTIGSLELGASLLTSIRATVEHIETAPDGKGPTRLLHQATVPTEPVLASLGFCCTCAFGQNLPHWHPEDAWMYPEKEKTATEVGGQYSIFRAEPLNRPSGFRFPHPDSLNINHHFELRNPRGTVPVPHPSHLRVCTCGAGRFVGYRRATRASLALGSHLAQDTPPLDQP